VERNSLHLHLFPKVAHRRDNIAADLLENKSFQQLLRNGLMLPRNHDRQLALTAIKCQSKNIIYVDRKYTHTRDFVMQAIEVMKTPYPVFLDSVDPTYQHDEEIVMKFVCRSMQLYKETKCKGYWPCTEGYSPDLQNMAERHMLVMIGDD